MPSPLSILQKRTLILQHLRPAFEAAGAAARAQGKPWIDTPAAFDYWRRETVAAACGKFGLRCCSQEDYTAILARCWDLRGRPDIAFNLLARDPRANERRQVEWKITDALSKAGLKIGYAAAICRNMWKCGLQEASVDQLWKLYYTVKNRSRSRVAQGSSQPRQTRTQFQPK